MAFDEEAFYKAQQKILNRLSGVIKELYQFNLQNPDFPGSMKLDHKANGASGDCNWKLEIKK